MAELTTHSHTRVKKGIARRSKKLSTSVDLTPMVDLGFLLITFFIVSTTLSKSKALSFYLPADGPPTPAPISASLTIMPLKSNQVFYYHGSLESAIQYQQYGTCDFSFDKGIGDVIRKKQSELDKSGIFKSGRKEMIIMIKPTAESDFKNVIKTFDEMLINRVGKYALVDICKEEKQFLAEKKLIAN
ncbi:MAG: biopolymer transporter ExbD [Bacteroidetes bacterium]|nr:biopolymer transporter ExbD [Bacteroidota bacterium]